jgi:heme/copper-type cytochrome/quinol oxidase subunit 3
MARDDATADRLNWRPPKYAYRLAMWVFLTSLGMLFASSLLGYAMMRYDGPQAPRHGAIAPPKTLFLSTALLLVGSGTMTAALRAVRREHQRRFRWLMAVSTLLAFAFLAVQTPALASMVNTYAKEKGELPKNPQSVSSSDDREHLRVITKNAGSRTGQLYAVVVSLVVLHALHVIGGLLPLAVATVRAFQGRYDHEVHEGVSLCAMYWHFLDVVWIVLFGAFLILG